MATLHDNILAKRRRFIHSLEHPFIYNVNTNLSTFNAESALIDLPLLQHLSSLSSRPPTPEEIEAELLRAKIRLRKPIAESKTTAFTPRPFFNMRRLSPETQAALCAGASAGTVNRQPISTATFCGINLAVLAHISISTNTTPIEEQQMWNYTTSRKRNLEFDEEEGLDGGIGSWNGSNDPEFMPCTPTLGANEIDMEYFGFEFDLESESERATSVTQVDDSMAAAYTLGRRVAKMRSRRKGLQDITTQQNAVNPFAQSQVPRQQLQIPEQHWQALPRMSSCGIEANKSLLSSSNGFGEAIFSQRREDMDMDCS